MSCRSLSRPQALRQDMFYGRAAAAQGDANRPTVFDLDEKTQQQIDRYEHSMPCSVGAEIAPLLCSQDPQTAVWSNRCHNWRWQFPCCSWYRYDGHHGWLDVDGRHPGRRCHCNMETTSFTDVFAAAGTQLGALSSCMQSSAPSMSAASGSMLQGSVRNHIPARGRE